MLDVSTRTSGVTSGVSVTTRVATFAAGMFFITVLLFSYKLKVVPLFAYQGLTFRQPDPFHGALAVGLVLIVVGVLPRRLRRASDYLQWMLFVIAGAPSILLAQVMTALPVAEATRFGLMIAGCTILSRVATARSSGLGRFKPGLELRGQAWALLIAYSIALYAYLFITTGVPTRWVEFTDVYDVRSEFITAQGTLLGYLLPVQYNVVNPIFMARGLFSRNWALLSVGIAGQVIIYLSQGQKGVLLSIFAMLGIMWLYRRGRVPSGGHLLVAVGVVALAALAVDALTNSFTYTALLVRRFLIIPGALTVAYVSVFKDRPKAHFHEFGLGDSPYGNEGPSFIVGREFLGYAHGNANVNLWGNGYLNYGYVGMVLMAALFICLLWVLDAATEGLPSAVLGVVLVRTAIVLSSASLLTSLLSHGLLALIVLCALLPREGWSANTISRPTTSSQGPTRLR